MKKTQPYFTTLLFIVPTIGQGYAQVIIGRVTDSNTGSPVIGATIHRVGTTTGTVTDEQGAFEIKSEVPVQVSFTGYQSQEIKPTDGYVRIYLVQSTLQLGEVVVTAYQANRELSTVAAPITVISKQDLHRGDNTSIIPILNAVPGVKLDYYTLGDYRLNIRGGALAQPSVHSSGYRMYWNGIPITSASGGNPLGGLDVNFIDNMEIIKGPNSSMYGAGFGGTVLVNTERASALGTSQNTDFMVGSYGTYRSTSGIRHNGAQGNVAVQYTKTKTNGYRAMTDSEGDVLNLFEQLYTGEKGTINLLYNYEKRNTNIAGDLDEETFRTAPKTANTIEPTGFGPNKHTFGLGYSYDFNERWSASVGGYYFDNQGKFVLSYPYFAIFEQAPSNGLNTRATATYKNEFGNVQLKVDVGAEYGFAHNTVTGFDGNFETDTASIAYVNEATTDQMLGFSQVELIFPNDIYVTAGASFNAFRYHVESGTNTDDPLIFRKEVDKIVPRLSVLKKFNTHSLYASIGQGFSPPAAGTSTDFLNPDGSVNDNLKASTGLNLEVGARGNTKNGLFFYDVALYHLTIRNAIISRLFEISTGINTERKTNAGEIRQTGLEALVGFNATNNLDNFWYGSQLRVGYTYNDYEYVSYQTFRTETDADFNDTFVAVDYSSKEIPGTIPNAWLVQADVKTRWGAYLNFTLNTYGETFLTDANTQVAPSYSVINVKAGYQANLLKNRLTLQPYVGANNLGNTLYSGLTAYNSPFGGFFNPAFRRQWFGGLQVNLKI